jgi:hypothetical protein
MADDSVAEEIDAIIAKAAGWRGETLARVRWVIVSADPEIVEAIKWRKPSRPEGVATWMLDGNICMADVLTSAVRLTFPKGTRIADPDGLFNARLDSSGVRAIDYAEGVPVDDAALGRLVQRAAAVNREG